MSDRKGTNNMKEVSSTRFLSVEEVTLSPKPQSSPSLLVSLASVILASTGGLSPSLAHLKGPAHSKNENKYF